MKKSRFTDSQILAILKQAENGISVTELCRQHGMSSAAFYKWRSKYGGMDASMMARIKELEQENARLKKKCMQMLSYGPRSCRSPLQKSGKAVFACKDGQRNRE